MKRRSALAILYSSFLFGSMPVPYLYILLLARFGLPPAFVLTVAWLAASTALLLGVFIERSRLEAALALRLGGYFRPLAIATVSTALGSSYVIELEVSSFPLSTSYVDWFNLIVVSAIATALAFLVIIATRPSRLAALIASRVDRINRSSTVYRAAAYLVLTMALMFVGSRLYQYHRFMQCCGGGELAQCCITRGQFFFDYTE